MLKRIAVLMGGRSPEHEISMQSGKAVLQALDPSRFIGRGIVISPDGLWSLFDVGTTVPGGAKAYAGGCPPEEAAAMLKAWGTDAVFPALHGPYGEDGTIQGFLHIMELPFASSDVAAAALAMDKPVAKAVVAAAGFKTPEYVVLERSEWAFGREQALARIAGAVGTPCFVKAAGLGSSVGIVPVERAGDLPAALDAVFREDRKIMVERAVSGREISCAVLGNAGGPLESLPPVEVRPVISEFFDYEAKYSPGGAEEICPAPIEADLEQAIREAAAAIHALVGARGFSRTDFMVDEEGPSFLELNAIPGLTPQSIFPRAAGAAGYTFSGLVTRILELALEER